MNNLSNYNKQIVRLSRKIYGHDLKTSQKTLNVLRTFRVLRRALVKGIWHCHFQRMHLYGDFEGFPLQ